MLKMQKSNDPWTYTLTAEDLENGKFSPLAANGGVAFKVPPEGQGRISYVNPKLETQGCLVPGIFSDDGGVGAILHGTKQDIGIPLQASLAPMPSVNGLRCSYNGIPYLMANGSHTEYRQQQDLRTGTVTTQDTWTIEGKTIAIETSVFAHRNNPNLSITTTTFTPDFDGEICIEDALDGSFITNGNEWQTHGSKDDPTILLTGKIGTRHREAVTASRLILPEGLQYRTEIETDPSNQSITRKIYIQVEKGKSYSITKHAGIYAHQNATAAIQDLQHSTSNPHIREEHKQAWRDIWAHNIELDGTAPELQRFINTFLYLLYAQSRPDSTWSSGPFGITGAYQWTRAMWDSDVFIGPAILLFHPELAKSIYAYRHKTLNGAFFNAHRQQLYLNLYKDIEKLKESVSNVDLKSALEKILHESKHPLESDGSAGLSRDSEVNLDKAIQDAAVLADAQLNSEVNEMLQKFITERDRLNDIARRIKAGEAIQMPDTYGARFAWESGEYGLETWFGGSGKEDHIVGDVAAGQYRYLLVSGDDAYRDQAAQVIFACAKYWQHRAEKIGNSYQLRGTWSVTAGGKVNNDLYTNLRMIQTLRIAIALKEQRKEDVPQEWLDIVNNTYLPRDPKDPNHYLIYEDPSQGPEEVIFIGAQFLEFPLDAEVLTPEQIKATIEYYHAQYPPNHNMLESPMNAIYDCGQQNAQAAWENFARTLDTFIGPTFGLNPDGICFLTGRGALLQTVISGFAGLRIRADGFMVNPCIPKEIGNSIGLNGIYHNGHCFDVIVTNEHIYTNAPESVKFLTPDGTQIKTLPIDAFHPQQAPTSGLFKPPAPTTPPSANAQLDQTPMPGRPETM